MFSDVILPGVLLPGLVAAAVLLVGTRPWRATHAAAGSPVAAALAGGFATAHLGLTGAPRLLPTDATGWLPHLAVMMLAVAVAQPLWEQRLWSRWLIRTTTALVAIYLLLRSPVHHQWSVTEGLAWIIAATAATVALWATLQRTCDAVDNRIALLLMALTAATSAGLLTLSGTLLLGVMSGSLAAATGAALLLSLLFPGALSAARVAPVFAVLQAGMWTIGFLFAEMPTTAAALVVAAPVALWLLELTLRRRASEPGPTRRLAIARIAALLIPLSAAAAIAASAYFAPPSTTDADDYGYEYDQ